jgi:hypothetical protein
MGYIEMPRNATIDNDKFEVIEYQIMNQFLRFVYCLKVRESLGRNKTDSRTFYH